MKKIKINRKKIKASKKQAKKTINENKDIPIQPFISDKYLILAIVLHEGKGSSWRWVKRYENNFSVGGHTYFVVDGGTYINDDLRFIVYLEGISTPIHHGFVKYETEKRKITTITGDVKELKVQVIKGLKFDSALIDYLLNRNLAERFTKSAMDLPNLFLILLLIVNVICNLGILGVLLS